MADDLELKARVIADLMEKGACEVIIAGSDIKVTRGDYRRMADAAQAATRQIVNVNVQASAYSSAEINLQLDAALEYLRSTAALEGRISELEEQITILKQELPKPSPNKLKIQSVLKWLLEKSWEAFIKLAPIVISKMGQST